MSVEPSARDIFESLSLDGSPKFVKALERIKDACDNIETAKGPMTYNQVGAMATKLFGGPKAQSIHNNAEHKRYIDARQREYRQAPASDVSGSTEAKAIAKYPAGGLDYKTRRYIDDLRQRNEMLEAAMREFRAQITRSTQENPIDLGQLISAGPAPDGAMILPAPVPATRQNALSPAAAQGLRAILLDLPQIVSEVENFQGKALRLRSGEWLLPPDQYAALKALLGDLPPDAS